MHFEHDTVYRLNKMKLYARTIVQMTVLTAIYAYARSRIRICEAKCKRVSPRKMRAARKVIKIARKRISPAINQKAWPMFKNVIQ